MIAKIMEGGLDWKVGKNKRIRYIPIVLGLVGHLSLPV